MYGVVFNEATTEENEYLYEPQPLYKDYDTELKSEVELCGDCERILADTKGTITLCPECYKKRAGY